MVPHEKAYIQIKRYDRLLHKLEYLKKYEDGRFISSFIYTLQEYLKYYKSDISLSNQLAFCAKLLESIDNITTKFIVSQVVSMGK